MGGHTRRVDEREIEPRRRLSRGAGHTRGHPSPSAHLSETKVRRHGWSGRLLSNVLLLGVALQAMRRADAVLFTGSPPLMLHFIAPLNLLLRKRLIYRITDFHPECLIAERGRSGLLLGGLLRLTQFWRRRVDEFEVLGLDQARRLTEMRDCGGAHPSQAQPLAGDIRPRACPSTAAGRIARRVRESSFIGQLGRCPR